MSSLTATEIVTLTILGGIAGFALGFLAATPQNTTIPNDPKDTSTSDWTLPMCSLWANDSDPVIPPYTITNMCVEDDGTVSIAPDAIPGGEVWDSIPTVVTK